MDEMEIKARIAQVEREIEEIKNKIAEFDRREAERGKHN